MLPKPTQHTASVGIPALFRGGAIQNLTYCWLQTSFVCSAGLSGDGTDTPHAERSLSSTASTTQGWGNLTVLTTGSPAEFHAFLLPLANATYLSYTATHGSYFKPADQNATIAGWTRQALESNPESGGMRALLFTQTQTGRALVVFRGTDLDISVASGQADACADDILSGMTHAQLPTFCKRLALTMPNLLLLLLETARFGVATPERSTHRLLLALCGVCPYLQV